MREGKKGNKRGQKKQIKGKNQKKRSLGCGEQSKRKK